MQGTRDHVLQFLISAREARVEQVAEAMGITGAAVRRHLDNLRADGLVDVRQVKQATGRPFYAYSPTAHALGEMPSGYADLMTRVLRSVEGRDDVTTAVASRMAESVADRHRGEIADATAEDRVGRVTESLKQEGILQEWHSGEDGIHLVNGTCPYIRAAEVSRLPCESDRQTIELLLGQEVLQLHRIVDGSPCCEYLVQIPAGATNPTEVTN